MLIPGSVGLSSRGGRLERLAAEDLVSAHSLLQTFEDGLAKYLNDTWAKLISDLEGRKLHDEFQQFLNLPDSTVALQFSNRINTDSGCVTVAQPLAASGTFLWISEPGKGRIAR